MASETPEQMLDVFRAAALSVTKLYKSSISAQARARADGYQDCLDDLLQFLDKTNLGLSDGEGWKIRAWANERLEGRDGSPQAIESDDDTEKPEPMSSPEIHRSSSTACVTQPPTTSLPRSEAQAQTEPATPVVQEIIADEPEIAVPTQDTFDFRSAHPYPQDAQPHLNLANLRLSDGRSHDNSISSNATISMSRPSPRNQRHGGNGRNLQRGSSRLGYGAGAKRKVNFGEFFDLGNLGTFRDTFGGSGAKRTRHN
ncbi:hypothetical protein VP1G_02730 [Cytospora mali]|uniref:Uncharacterized protein n=1 Tax=Cytospora mali TaxID=578113 RepID=A0A194UUQ1_CYTMA|nr:hypothetical protein VP1G_02730 [Valsa mali var. pyri (nom. inval.)]